jgi:hypothetical protein
MKAAGVVFVLTWAAVAIAGAQPRSPARGDRPPQPPQAPTPTFRAATRLVQVTVVVHSKDGKPVPGLTAADFKLYEDGKEQPIQIFSVESDRVMTSSAAPLPHAGTFSNCSKGRALGAA